MKFLSSFLLIVAVVVFSACSNEQAVVVDKSIQGQKLSDDNVFKDYETVLDKSKGVEKTIQSAADLQRIEIEKQGY